MITKVEQKFTGADILDLYGNMDKDIQSLDKNANINLYRFIVMSNLDELQPKWLAMMEGNHALLKQYVNCDEKGEPQRKKIIDLKKTDAPSDWDWIDKDKFNEENIKLLNKEFDVTLTKYPLKDLLEGFRVEMNDTTKYIILKTIAI